MIRVSGFGVISMMYLCFMLAGVFGASEPVAAQEGFPRADGYRGIWYGNQPSGDLYHYKYSGGLGTYTAKHIPLAIYAPEVEKTFFCYGGRPAEENTLIIMVSYYDHRTDTVPRPTIIIDKKTSDAHDNPTIQIDDNGYVWLFVSAHGTARPSYIYKSVKPYEIDDFTLIKETNFSYPQPWYIPGRGFIFLHTLYRDGRILHWSTSPDGVEWSEPQVLSQIAQGHYQVSRVHDGTIATAFNYHPDTLHKARHESDADTKSNGRVNGLNYRTNLYYLESSDFGETWRTASGKAVATPLTAVENDALIYECESAGKLAYMKDLTFDRDGRPVILFIESNGYEAGPGNGSRIWSTAHWNGESWDIRPGPVSDNNYDMGSIYVDSDGSWRIIGPTELGPQAYNPGGEVSVWISIDEGATWRRSRALTAESPCNHSYVRRPVNANPEFMAFWADGHGREESPSRLYYYNDVLKRVFRLPWTMTGENARPEPVDIASD